MKKIHSGLISLGMSLAISVSALTPAASANLTESPRQSALTYGSEPRVTGMITGLRHLPDSRFKNVIYAAPDDSLRNTSKLVGTKENPYTLNNAISHSSKTDACTILLLDGVYNRTGMLDIKNTNNGTPDKYKLLKASEGAEVIFDYSGDNSGEKSNYGIKLSGSYWYIGGIRINGTDASNGMRVIGSYNVIEDCVFSNNGETGLQLDNFTAGNYILNSTAYNNCDVDNYGDADGFAPKLKVGVGNVFDGCISYNNIDDGWDLYSKGEGNVAVVTIRNSITAWNGDTTDKKVETATGSPGEGNGFKLGGDAYPTPHVLENCLAFENGQHGYTDNNNPSGITLTNCSSIDNGQRKTKGSGFSLWRTSPEAFFNRLITVRGDKARNYNDALVGDIENSVFWYKSFKEITGRESINTDIGIVPGTNITGPAEADFVSLTPPKEGEELHKLFRNPNGTINTHGYMQLKEDSKFYGLGAEFNGIYSIKEIGVELFPPEISNISTAYEAKSPRVSVSVNVEATGKCFYSISDKAVLDADSVKTGASVAVSPGTEVFSVMPPVKKQYIHVAAEDELGYTTNVISAQIIMRGDINSNGAIDTDDILRVLRYTTGARVPAFTSAKADANGDGQVDNLDAVFLLRALAGVSD